MSNIINSNAETNAAEIVAAIKKETATFAENLDAAIATMNNARFIISNADISEMTSDEKYEIEFALSKFSKVSGSRAVKLQVYFEALAAAILKLQKQLNE